MRPKIINREKLYRSRCVPILGVLFLLLAAFQDVLACNCRMPAVCEAYSSAETIFIGKLDHITEVDVSTSLAVFDVKETLKGKPAGQQIVKFATGSCELTFLRPGQDHLVYESGSHFQNTCGRTGLLANAGADLQYIRGLSQTKPIYTIHAFLQGPSLEEIKTTLFEIDDGDQKNKVLPDKDGIFSFTTKRQGKFTVRILLPFEAKAHGYEERISTTGARTMIEYDLNSKPNGCDFSEIFVDKTEKKN